MMNYTKLRGHQLMTAALRRKLPKLYTTESLGEQALAQVCYFTPDSNWYWYATEFDGEDTFFGLTFGPFVELGYFSLQELEQTLGPWRLPIERNLYFKPRTLAEIKKEHQQREGEQARHY